MLKENSTIIRRALILLDGALLGSSFYAAFYLRFAHWPGAEDWSAYGWINLIFIPALLINFYRAGIYHKIRYYTLRRLCYRLLLSFLAAAALVAAALFLSHATDYSRLLFLYFVGISGSIIAATKLTGKIIIDRARTRGVNFRSVILLGAGTGFTRLQTILKPGNPYGLKVIVACALEDLSPEAFARQLTSAVVDEVYFALPRKTRSLTIDPYLEKAEAVGKTCKIILNINENRRSKCEMARLEELPLVVLYPVTLDPDQLLIKRLLDICGALVGLAINVVLFPFLAGAIKLDSKGPIFFRQIRIGENGRRFTIYKYRSMIPGAEQRKAELKNRNQLAGAVFKVTGDPRITRCGRFLRKLSLDELPQFWNVLKGEMSLVGTRPPTPDEVEDYLLDHHRRLSIKPGITGLWQVSGRNKITNFDEIVALDTRYIDQWSIFLDLKILAKTLVAAWKGQ
ncbi:MAG: sugar transferase [Deltaproteobacteria bacterium]|nr:sugar transferase [Deltaproteobacteria bacterium]